MTKLCEVLGSLRRSIASRPLRQQAPSSPAESTARGNALAPLREAASLAHSRLTPRSCSGRRTRGARSLCLKTGPCASTVGDASLPLRQIAPWRPELHLVSDSGADVAVVDGCACFCAMASSIAWRSMSTAVERSHPSPACIARLIPRSERSSQRSTSAESRSTSLSSASGCTMSVTRPIRKACAASIVRAVNRSSRALALPTSRGRRCVAPTPPWNASGHWNVAFVVATIGMTVAPARRASGKLLA